MELTIKQYAEKRSKEYGKKIGKGYIHRLVRCFEEKPHLMPDVESVEVKTDAFGTNYYVLKLKKTNNKKK